MLTLHSFLFFLAILLSSSERDRTEALRSLEQDSKELFVTDPRWRNGRQTLDKKWKNGSALNKMFESERKTHSWEEMGPSEDAEQLERPEEALDRVDAVDMRRRVEDRM